MNNGSLQADTLIADRYRILQKIGEGGMAAVYRVEQIFLHEILALKVLSGGLPDNSSARFQKEAQVCRLLEHPNLIKVFDFAVLEDGSPYLVMEFIDGETLTQRLNAKGALSETEAIDIFIQIMDGLEYAHSTGVVHRDLKPSNIMLMRDAKRQTQVKILDFGIAKMTNKNAISVMDLTRTGEIFGSPLYMSPEQCLGKTVDSRSDLYSAGCALYQTLTGAPPFVGATALATVMMHSQSEPLALTEASFGQQFSPAIEMLIMKLLAKSPAERYQTASEVRDDLCALKSRRTATIITREKAPTSKNKALPVVSPAVLILSIICALLTITLVFVLTNQKNLSDTRIAQETAQSSVQAAPPSPVVSSRYYARTSMQDAKGNKWQLDFPPVEIGRIALADPDGNLDVASNQSVGAKNKVLLAEARPLYFACYMDHGLGPDLFSKFRDDEIKQLIFIEWYVEDEALAAIKHFKALDCLRLSKCSSLTDKCLPSIAALPNLRTLIVEENNTDRYKLEGRLGNIGSAPLGQMVAKSKIKSLKIYNFVDTDALVHALTTSKNLESLSLDRVSDFSPKGLADLAKIRTLRKLKIIEAAEISNDAIIQTLKKLPKGCFVDIDSTHWPQKDQAALEAACPGHIVK